MATLPGTGGNDIIIGTKQGDVIELGDGTDEADGRGGGDEIYGDFILPFEYIAEGITNTESDKTFDSDSTLEGNSGNDLVYGDLVSVVLKAEGGVVTDGFVSATIANKTVIFGSEGVLGPNSGIFGGGGKDTLYGDAEFLELTALGGSATAVSSGAFAEANIIDNVFTFGNDDIVGGAGSDTIYGDLSVFNITATGGTASGDGSSLGISEARFVGNDFNFGDDNIWGGAASDVIYGDLDSLNINLTGGNASSLSTVGAAMVSSAVFGDPLGQLNLLDFGDDNIWGGSGSDTIYGDLSSLDITLTGGIASGGDDIALPSFSAISGAVAVYQNSEINFGDDDIWGEEASDVIYGDLASLNVNLDAGTAESISTGPSVTASGGGVIFGGAIPDVMNFGEDDIWGGSGSDIIYGDLSVFNITARGGTAFALGSVFTIADATASYVNNEHFFGNDNIWGEDGSDTLYGDLLSLNMTAIDGVATGSLGGIASADAVISDNVFTFGDDVLDGGGNADTLYGDFLELNLVADLDTSTLMTGAGNHIEIEDDDGNIYTFGNDLLTGGAGNDVFSFTLLEVPAGVLERLVMPGNDQITDFDFGHDTLEFRDVLDTNVDGDIDIFDLAAVTTLSLEDVDGDGHVDDLLIQFNVGIKDAGSVGLLDFTTNPSAPVLSTPPSILDIANVIDIVPA